MGRKVPLSVMPKGVEHVSSRPVAVRTISCASLSDAERR